MLLLWSASGCRLLQPLFAGWLAGQCTPRLRLLHHPALPPLPLKSCPTPPPCTLPCPLQLVAKVLPAREAIDEVQRIAQSFWAEHPDLYIAIHCAYGQSVCQSVGLPASQFSQPRCHVVPAEAPFS